MINPALLRLVGTALLVGLAVTACDDNATGPENLPNIVEAAVADEDFETLVAAVTAAGLAETLQGEGPFTVFAPSDEAFAKIPAETLASLLLPENIDQLTSILTYHVVEGLFLAEDVLASNTLTSLQGQQLTISLDGQTPRVNESAIVATDVLASNGVIHVIDSVLLPN
jgi:uncharacterized surface protein with fasciclin (FAS1) repeats